MAQYGLIVSACQNSTRQLNVSYPLQACCHEILEVEQTSERAGENGWESFAYPDLKHQRLNSQNISKAYVESRFFFPTSRIFEILFSKAGYVHRNRRMRYLLANIEAQIFFHMKKDIWGVKDIKNVISQRLSLNFQ